MHILVVAAHPDDEVLGCGGTIARLAKAGHEINIGILGEGVTSRNKSPNTDNQSELAALHENCRKAANSLDAGEPIFHNLPDNQFDSLPLLDIVKKVESLIECFRPEVIYTHHGGDLNIDHTLTHRAVLTATRPIVGCTVRDIYAFEVASSTDWSFQQFKPVFSPNVFADISKTIEIKIAAMQIYESEIRDFPHPRTEESLRIQARKWGATVGIEYAEAFELIRSIR